MKNINIKKSIEFCNSTILQLVKLIKQKRNLSSEIHNKIIDFCTIVSPNRNYYKDIDVDFKNFEAVQVKSLDYNKNKYVKLDIKKEGNEELIDKELLVLTRLKKYLKLKEKLEN